LPSSLDDQDIDWELVFKKLLVRARFLTGGLPGLFDSVDANDLVSETLVSFFDSPTALGWNPAIGSVESFLMGVLKNKLRDHLRRSRRFEPSFSEPSFREIRENDLGPVVEHFRSEVLDELRNRVKGDKGLLEVIDAVVLIDASKRDINRQLAELLHVTSTEVVNRKKRLARILRGVEGVR
jgi:DNA-directed RNA polymerase specialized sigma24 family protein